MKYIGKYREENEYGIINGYLSWCFLKIFKYTKVFECHSKESYGESMFLFTKETVIILIICYLYLLN